MTKKEKIPADVAIAIASALGRYLKDDKLAFHIVASREDIIENTKASRTDQHQEQTND